MINNYHLPGKMPAFVWITKCFQILVGSVQRAEIFKFQFTDIILLSPILRSGESPELGLEVGF
jgi:hypothetical protein